MLTLSAAVLAASLLPAGAAQLRFYPTFAEVRDAAAVTNGQVRVTLPASLYDTIVPGSLGLDGVAVTQSRLTQQPNWLASLEGQTLTLTEDGRREPVTLVRARDLLVRDAQGQYRTVQAQDLAFPALPPLNAFSPSWLATFDVSGAGSPTLSSPALSYLTRGLGWSPRYTLKVAGGALSGNGVALSALADLRNTTDADFSAAAGAQLYAGDVPLEGGEVRPLAFARDAVAASVAAAPKVASTGELRGLYTYALSSAFTLPAQSTLSLPFLNAQVSGFERYGALSSYFGSGGASGNLSRGYRFRASEALPAGPLTLREDGVLVGQVGLDATPAGTPVTLNLGADPDLRYTRAVTSSKAGTGANAATVTRVTYTLTNAKDRPVRAEITEQGLGSRATLTGAVAGQVTRTDTGNVLLRVDVPAKAGATPGQATVSFTVTVPVS